MASSEVQPGDKVSWPWSGNRPSGEAQEVNPDSTTITTHRGNEVTKHGDSEDPAVKIMQGNKEIVKQAHEVAIEEKGSGHDGVSGGDQKSGEEEKKAEETKEEHKEEKAETNGTNVQSLGGEKEQKEPEKKDEASAPTSGEHMPLTGAPDSSNSKSTYDKPPSPEKKEDEHASEAPKTEAKKEEDTNMKEDTEKENEKNEDKTIEKSKEDQNKQDEAPKKAGRPKSTSVSAASKKAEKPRKRAATETGEPRRSKRLRG